MRHWLLQRSLNSCNAIFLIYPTLAKIVESLFLIIPIKAFFDLKNRCIKFLEWGQILISDYDFI